LRASPLSFAPRPPRAEAAGRAERFYAASANSWLAFAPFLLSPARHRALDLALVFAALDVLALVVLALASGKPEFHLRPPSAEVEREWDEGEAAFVEFAGEAANLAAVDEEFALAGRLVVAVGGLLVRAYVEAGLMWRPTR